MHGNWVEFLTSTASWTCENTSFANKLHLLKQMPDTFLLKTSFASGHSILAPARV